MVWTSLARTERNHERGEQRISVHNRVVHHQRQAIDKDFLLLLLGLTDGEVDYDPAEPNGTYLTFNSLMQMMKQAGSTRDKLASPNTQPAHDEPAQMHPI
ncbi:MAG: hypothetical protein WBJ68_10080, partial [Candidatus Dechloromonas phosphoritropha]